jgi:small subunit ribosomal protein S1
MDQLSAEDMHSDFAQLLEQSFEIKTVERGDIRKGVILAIDEQGIIVDIGLKRDGLVPRAELERMGHEFDCQVGDEVSVMVIKPEDSDGNLVVSLQQAIANQDWEQAEALMTNDQLYQGEVIEANKGGLIVPFGELRGFVPASHVDGLPRGLSDEERRTCLSERVGRTLTLKIIEVNPQRRRLVLSERDAEREARDQAKASLLESLAEGQVVRGRVSGMRDFGAFVDLGGADGLIHVSELAWRRVKHPSEVLKVGDEIDVYVLRLDQEGKRIGLSLKRLQENPWRQVEEHYQVGQVVEGVVSRVVSFGVFVELPTGIEALLHVSQISDPPPEDVSQVLQPGQQLHVRIIGIEAQRQRMGLSLKDLPEEHPAGEDVPVLDVQTEPGSPATADPGVAQLELE